MPDDDGIVLSEETFDRFDRAAEHAERQPGTPPLRETDEPPQPAGRPNTAAVLLEDLTEGDQVVKALVLRAAKDEEVQFVSLRGVVHSGTNHPESTFKLRFPDAANPGANLTSDTIRGDATAAELQDAMSEVLGSDVLTVSAAPERVDVPGVEEPLQFAPHGKWWLRFAPEWVEANGEVRLRHGRRIRKAQAVTVAENNLEIPPSTTFSNFVLVQRTNWLPTHRVVDVTLDTPVFSLTTAGNSATLQAGTQVSLNWDPGLGYAVARAESRFLRLFLDEPRR